MVDYNNPNDFPYTGHQDFYYHGDRPQEAQDAQDSSDYQAQHNSLAYQGQDGSHSHQEYQASQNLQQNSAELGQPAFVHDQYLTTYGRQQHTLPAQIFHETNAPAQFSPFLFTTSDYDEALRGYQLPADPDRRSNYSSDPSVRSAHFDVFDSLGNAIEYASSYVGAPSNRSTTTASNSGSVFQITPPGTQSTDQYSGEHRSVRPANRTSLEAEYGQQSCLPTDPTDNAVVQKIGEWIGQPQANIQQGRLSDQSVSSDMTVGPPMFDPGYGLGRSHSISVTVGDTYDDSLVLQAKNLPTNTAPWNPLGATHVLSSSADWSRDPAEQLREKPNLSTIGDSTANESGSCWRCFIQKLKVSFQQFYFHYVECDKIFFGKGFRKAFRLSCTDSIPGFLDLFLPQVLQNVHHEDRLRKSFDTNVGFLYDHTVNIRISNEAGFEMPIPASEFIPKTMQVSEQIQFSEEKGEGLKSEYSPPISYPFATFDTIEAEMEKVLNQFVTNDRMIYDFPSRCFHSDLHQQYILSAIAHFYVRLARSNDRAKEKTKDVEFLCSMFQLLMLTYSMTHALTLVNGENEDPIDLVSQFRDPLNISCGLNQTINRDTSPKIINSQLKSKLCLMQRACLNNALKEFHRRLRTSSNEECLVPLLCALLMLCMVVEEHQASAAELAYVRLTRQAQSWSANNGSWQSQTLEDEIPDVFTLRKEMDEKIYFLIDVFRAKYATKRAPQVPDLLEAIKKRIKTHAKGGTGQYREFVKTLINTLTNWMDHPGMSSFAKFTLN
ncbi:MAG: hypothetical protein M1814_004576 [Vezdaea aestivalis]|nr:MAG: hypothetical protein M1814_004576 [Vezdaea aestivalis]